MVTRKICIGVVGTGAAARAHVEAVRMMKGADVIALAGKGLAKAKSLCDRLRINSCYDNAEALFQSNNIDAVILAVPPFEMADLAVSAFAHGKHVLCEKPLGVGVPQAERVLAAWRRSRRVGMVNFCYRFIPELQEFRSRLDSGACGRLILIKAEWVLANRLDPMLTYHWKGQRELGGGVLQNYGVHILDYLFHDHSDVTLLGAHQTTVASRRLDAAGELREVTGDEGTTVFFLRSNVPVLVHLSLVTRPGFGLKFIAQGTEGTLELSNNNMSFPAGPFKLILRGASERHAPVRSKGLGLEHIFRHTIKIFLDTINGRGKGEPSLECGLKAARLVEEIQKRAERSSHFPR